MAINYYQLLGIPEDADLRRIRAAYRSMAKRFHPDTNHGSEAAAELFRQLNDAYRILSDDRLRQRYKQKLAAATPGQAADRTEKPPAIDPEKKFNRFLNTLLDAIFTTPDQPPTEPMTTARPPKTGPPRKVRRKPDFNFYYYLAMERSAAPYRCDDDGIYRRSPKKT